MTYHLPPVLNKSLHGAASAQVARGIRAQPGRVGDTGQHFDAAAWQASMDAEGRFLRLRHAVRMSRYMPARPEGEPPLLVGVAVTIGVFMAGAYALALVLPLLRGLVL